MKEDVRFVRTWTVFSPDGGETYNKAGYRGVGSVSPGPSHPGGCLQTNCSLNPEFISVYDKKQGKTSDNEVSYKLVYTYWGGTKVGQKWVMDMCC